MDIPSDTSSAADEGRGFQFPGTFELSAMGAADKDLETVLPTLLLDAGIEVLHETVNWKLSSTGRYVSVRIAFRADTREDYDRAHQALRDHPEVKWTL
jgi:putative lipoic acid-binding regulatory protein